MKKMNWLVLAFALVLAVLTPFAGSVPPSLAQQGQQPPPASRKPACGCYICGTRPGYALFDEADKNCYGILAADACGEELKNLPEEKLDRFCQEVKAKAGFSSFKDSCPIYAPYCESRKKPEDKCDTKKACEAIRDMQKLIARYEAETGFDPGSFSRFAQEFGRLLQALSEALACRFNQGSSAPSNAEQLKDFVGQLLRDKNSFRSLNDRSEFPKLTDCVDRTEERPIRPSLVNACADYDTIGRIRTNLSRLGGVLGCPGAPQTSAPAKTDCKEFSNALLDGLTTFFDQMDELQSKNLVGSGDSYDQVADGIESAIKEAEAAARDIEGTGGTGSQQLKDIQEGKLNKLRQYLDLWKKAKAASCLPPEIQELLRRLATQKRAGTEHKDTCTELCGATADWYVKISGLSPQYGTFFKVCTAACF